MTLEGKSALVTGAGQGIGQAIAIALAEAGAEVAAVDRDVGAAENTAQKVQALDRRALAIEADIGELGDIDAMVTQAAEALGGIDVLVNNAGVNSHGRLLDITEETWDLMQKVNAKGSFFCLQRVAQRMVEQDRGGRIINIASIGGKGFRGTASPAYAASKGAIIAMTYIAAVHLAPHDITVNAICPGMVDTQMLRGMLAQRADDTGQSAAELLAGLQETVPLGRLIEAEEIAATVVFLAGPGGRNITGQTLNVDGGLIMS